MLYLVGTFAAALVAVAASFAFPSTLTLTGVEAANKAAPGGIAEVLRNLLLSLVANPVQALLGGNYIGILAWAALLGAALRHASQASRIMVVDFANAVSSVVRWIIRFAPLGIFGLVLTTIVMESFKGI